MTIMSLGIDEMIERRAVREGITVSKVVISGSKRTGAHNLSKGD
jgi:hypothetical protein